MGSDLFIHPSLRDAFPVPLLNAMSAAERMRKLFTLSGWADRMELLYREVIDDARTGRSSRRNSYARLDVRLLGLNLGGTSHARTSNGNGRSRPTLSPKEPVPVGVAG